MPENTLPSFAAGLALGADEIEFDVRLTGDNRLVVSHDGHLDRISDGKGLITDYTLEELRKVNIDAERGWSVGFCTPQEVFEQFANKITFNIHLKEHGEDGFIIRELLKLVEKYNAFDSVYFAGSPGELEWMEKIAPDIRRVAIQFPEDTVSILETAKKYKCSGVQFWQGCFDTELINAIHNEGMWCNLFWADSAADYDKYFEMGIDTLLTNRADLSARYRIEKNM